MNRNIPLIILLYTRGSQEFEFRWGGKTTKLNVALAPSHYVRSGGMPPLKLFENMCSEIDSETF